MNLIAHKSNLYNIVDFLNMVFDNDYINGAMFELTMTSDNKVVVFSPVFSNEATLDTIQSSTYAQIKSEDMITLENVVSYFSNTNKRLLLNILPLSTMTLNDETFEKMAQRNVDYIARIQKQLARCNNKNISLISADNKVLYHLKKNLSCYKLGLFLSRTNLTYEDVDMYIFPSDMYSRSLIRQQILLNKEAMIFASSSTDLDLINKAILSKEVTVEEIKNTPNFGFITNYPELLHTILK